jgi:hypothetical protein
VDHGQAGSYGSSGGEALTNALVYCQSLFDCPETGLEEINTDFLEAEFWTKGNPSKE